MERVAADELGSWLLAVPAGRVVVLSGTDASAVRSALAASAQPPDRRIGVVFPLDPSGPAGAVAERTAAALGAAAFGSYPYWYGSDALAEAGFGSLDATLLDARLQALSGTIPGLSPLWARHAAAQVLAGRVPVVAGWPLAPTLCQLALALNHSGITLIPVLSHIPVADEAAVAETGLEWLARATEAAVVALVPGLLEVTAGRIGRLDRAVLSVDVPGTGENAVVDRAMDAAWAGPVEGRPHWASAAEQALAAALASDADLRGMFAFNQVVATCRGGRPRVDLLARTGKVVVEIDSYGDHSGRDAFRRDRQRDYELAISGYLVLRLTSEEVLADPALSLDKLRDAIAFRNSTNTMEAPP